MTREPTDILKAFLLPALLFDQLQNPADIFFVGDYGADDRLFDLRDLAQIRPSRRIIDLDQSRRRSK